MSLRRSVRKIAQKTDMTGVVMSVMINTATVRLSRGGQILHGINVIGGPVTVGQTVNVVYSNGIPHIETSAPPTTTAVYFPSSPASSPGVVEGGFVADDDPDSFDLFTATGWEIDSDGSIINSDIRLSPAGRIVLGTSTNIIELNAQDASYRMWAGAVTGADAPFSVSVAGAIKAISGTLAGWTLAANTLTAADTSSVISSGTNPYIKLGATAYNNGVGFWVGRDGASSYDLFIGNSSGNKLLWDGSAGTLSITGSLTAESGSIGGWSIGASTIYSGTLVLTSGTYPKITGGASTYRSTTPGFFLGSNSGTYVAFIGDYDTQYIDWDGTDLIIQGTLRSANYVAGSAGWQITDDGDAEFNNVLVRGSIECAVFEKALISAHAGSTIVTKSASVLAADCVVPGSGTWSLTVKKQAGGAPFANLDIIRIKDDTSDTWMTVDTGSASGDNWVYTATYKSGTLSHTYKEGLTAIDYGDSVNGDGGLLLTADNTNAPFLSIFQHAGAPWSSMPEMVRLGNLNGNYDYSSKIYGIALGEYASSKPNITIDPTNGLRIRNYTSTVMQFSASGSAAITGNMSITGSLSAAAGGIVIDNNALRITTPQRALQLELFNTIYGSIFYNIQDETYGPYKLQLGVGKIGSNIITNAGFESGSSGWTIANGGISTVNPRTGTNSAYISNIAADGSIYNTTLVAASANTNYTLEYYYRVAQAASTVQSILATLSYYNSSDALISSTSEHLRLPTSVTGWLQNVTTHRSPAGTAKLRLTFFMEEDITSGAIVNIDDISVASEAYGTSLLLCGGMTYSYGQFSNDLYAKGNFCCEGGVYLGAITTAPGTGSLDATGNIRLDGGIYIGNKAGTAVTDALIADGYIQGASLVTESTLTLTESSTPSTPASGKAVFWVDTAGKTWTMADDGTSLPTGVVNMLLDPLNAYTSGTRAAPAAGDQFVVQLHDGVSEAIDWNMALPRGWAGRTVTIYFYWSPSTTNALNAYFSAQLRRVANGVNLATSATSSAVLASAAPGVVDRVKMDSMSLSFASFSEGDAVIVRLYRAGANALDTFTGIVQVSAVKLTIS